MLFAFRRVLLASLLLTAGSVLAQTFRGALTGTVSDASGAAIPNATVELRNPATDSTIALKSNGAGEFNFAEVPVGKYTLSISNPGFVTQKIDEIQLDAAKIVSEKITLSVGAQSETVSVEANGVQTDTASSALVGVIDSKSVQEMPMNGRNFTQMTHFTAGANALTNSINGSRTASINFQVDGTDNVDAWLGIVASNQGGIAGVAGGLIPIEAIDQFSMQSAGEADQGRNAGANSNMVIRSGTNNIHGDVFYFDRNEFFAAISPVAPEGSRKAVIRNHQGGFTLGGPIWKDHTFLFTAGEIQIAKINTSLTDTVLSDAWINAGKSFLGRYNLQANPLSVGLYNLLYPANSKGGPATTNNYFANGVSNYSSYNGIIKLDHHVSEKQTVSLRYLGTTGKQTAPTNSFYSDYFQTAPMHIHNFSVIHTYIFNSHLLNQVLLGTNYFLQTFNDANQNFNPQTNAGLNLGTTGIIAAGSPTITVGGTTCGSGTFDCVGATQPSGRTDVTGHITDSLHWTLGRHALKFGGEYRRANINQLYFASSRGTFGFDGTRGPWFATANGSAGSTANATALGYCTALGFTTSSQCNALSYVADYLNGQPSNSSGARLLQGNAQRVWTLNTEEAWAQDSFQASKKLNLSFGVRYSIPGVVTAERNDVYSFVPGQTPGFQLGLYPNYYSAVAPRVGFAYSPLADDRTVLRGSYGIFYDVPAMSSWVSGTTTNGGAAYAQNNPAGPDAAAIFIGSNITWQANVNPFVGTNAPQVGAFGVNRNFKMPYSQVFSLNLEQQFTRSTLFTLGYVGSEARRLEVLYDINQPVANGTSTTSPRPYSQLTAYTNENPSFVNGKTLSGINQLNFGASSNYNSLQATLRQAAWKGIQTTVNYTWSKSMDDASSNTTPMNSYNIHQDYGPSTFDSRHVLDGFVYYNVPQLFHAMPRMTKGWQLNALYTYSTGIPINPLLSNDNSRTGQLKDRPNVTGANPYSGLQLAASTSTGRQYRWLNNTGNAAFTSPTVGTYGNERRDAYYGPNFRTIDFSMFKHTPVTERVNSEFRVEIFNIFNFNNFANPSVSNINSSTFGLITNTRNGASAPGIGYGEPFNVQFALKLSF